ncbi:chitinase [Myxococcus llanfairpwllgwyngyllgogerychwyrndrobwllllantysiliogogogochensis]|uniref:chitinase n=1 Tax=Myxococcus llanfairpwllgwyngyllgogerychwyrndrobwllllantysiliogogogochensis TaxID=2590453 RepID=A0A540WVI2_9BACT|nr:glycosyl hydrolase family 18 protein [Myxococcus llanfairpwllgwyngyllgogerychwyrndrobwllllantysiliogogogochensis]TQF13022.1 chitinase [Myxococcus llanfairpwllgwyngyllgogerychwyrndrobwllllantysiliogogogochensis]
MKRWVGWVSLGMALLWAWGASATEQEPQAPANSDTFATNWIYRDAMESPWFDYSWATHSLRATSPVAEGQYSISATMRSEEALYFYTSPHVADAGATFILRVHGGTAGTGAVVRVRAYADDTLTPGTELGPRCTGGRILANTWVTCTVPFSALVAPGARIKGLLLQEGRGVTLPTLYFDSLRAEGLRIPSPVVVTLNPASLSMTAGTSRTFIATVTGSTNTAVTWSVLEGAAGGSITTSGRYTAPRTPGTYHVVATSVADPTQSATAPVRVTPAPASGLWVSGYYTGWNADLYPPEKVDFSAMTHIVVGRVTPNPDGTVNTQFDNDNGPAIARTLSTRAHAANRKAIIMVGGSGEHDGWVGAASNANRARFVSNLLAAMDSFGYDGLDIDWEPVEAADKPFLLALVRELRTARPDMLLTFPINWINSNFPEDADPWFLNLVPYLDQINVMSYEMTGPWGGWTSWYSSALTGESGTHPTSVASSLNAWVAAGIPKAKLGMGLPFYGMAWRNITGPYQPYTDWSDYVGSDNDFTYGRILALTATGGVYHWDSVAQSSYVTFATPVVDGTVRWISYDSPQAIAAKGAYARANGFGGTIIWTLNQGCTNPVTGANPPLDAVKGAFLP